MHKRKLIIPGLADGTTPLGWAWNKGKDTSQQYSCCQCGCEIPKGKPGRKCTECRKAEVTNAE